jgi:8-oxo-dGTP pyrophosphatase MutT (NUDIX family)
VSAELFHKAEFLRRAEARLLKVAPEFSLRSDDDLNQNARMIPANEKPKQAAVLVPIVVRPDGLSILLTERTKHLSKHAGQISFPGGRIDDDDLSPTHAALREAWEEIGLRSEFIRPIGFLDGYRTITNYHVVPVVGLVRDGFQLQLQVEEVASAFEVPLEFLMSDANHERHTRPVNGQQRNFFAMPFGERYIWGATAGMLRNMYERIYGS